jgi:hypothetical protein
MSLRERSRSLTRCLRLVLRRGLARLAAGQQAARLVAVLGRDGECPARRAQHTNMHAGQELLALGSAHGNPPDGFPSGRCRGPVACQLLRGGPKCPARCAPPRRRPLSNWDAMPDDNAHATDDICNLRAGFPGWGILFDSPGKRVGRGPQSWEAGRAGGGGGPGRGRAGRGRQDPRRGVSSANVGGLAAAGGGIAT